MHVLVVDDQTVIILQNILKREIVRLELKQKRGDLHTEDIPYIQDLRDMVEDLDHLDEMEPVL